MEPPGNAVGGLNLNCKHLRGTEPPADFDPFRGHGVKPEQVLAFSDTSKWYRMCSNVVASCFNRGDKEVQFFWGWQLGEVK